MTESGGGPVTELTGARGASADPGTDLGAVVTDVVTTILPGLRRAEVTGDKHLKDLGADSVDRVEIIALLLDRLGLDEPMSAFSELPDLAALVGFLRLAVAGRRIGRVPDHGEGR